MSIFYVSYLDFSIQVYFMCHIWKTWISLGGYLCLVHFSRSFVPIITYLMIFHWKKKQTKDVKEIALKTAALPKEDEGRPRIVVFTQGEHPTIIVQDGKATEYPVIPLKEGELVDTNGAGDAFVGGQSRRITIDLTFYCSKIWRQYCILDITIKNACNLKLRKITSHKGC